MKPIAIDRAGRIAWWIAAAAVGVAFVAVLAFVLGTITSRPLEYVEGEVLFDASRLRDHLRLYIDPLTGAFDYGPVPSRYYVAYVPIWAWLLSHLPAGAAAVTARALDLCAWYGLLGFIAWRATARSRFIACSAAAFVGATYTLAYFATSARPDAVPVVLAGIALWRAARDRGVDAIGGVLFALAAWTKPNVVGMAAGALLWPVVSGRPRDVRGLVGAAVTSALLALTLQIVTAGAWLPHLIRSTHQPQSVLHLLSQLRAVAASLLAPLAGAVLWGARRRRDPEAAVVFPALLTSVAWTMFSLTKFGTTDNHWLEPSVAAVILLARVPPPDLGPLARRAWPFAAAAQACALAAVSVHSSIEGARLAPGQSALIARARQICGAQPGDIVVAPDIGIEFMMNGRILTTPFQMTYLARAGQYPLSLWMADLDSVHVRGIVMENDVLELPPAEAAFYDRLDPPLRALLAREFVLAEVVSGLRVYRRADSPPRPSPSALLGIGVGDAGWPKRLAGIQ
jgi:hypothetical protein